MEPAIRKFIQDVLSQFPQQETDHICIARAALKLDCSPKFLREHLGEFFPNAWRFPGKWGEVRIPVKDIEECAERFRLFHLDKRKKRATQLPA